MTDTNQIDVRAFEEFERDRYSAAAAGYDQASARVTATANPAILDVIRASNGKKILDVACGPGWLSEAAIARGADVTGIDFAPNMVRLATSRNPSGQFREGDAEDLPSEASNAARAPALSETRIVMP